MPYGMSVRGQLPLNCGGMGIAGYGKRNTNTQLAPGVMGLGNGWFNCLNYQSNQSFSPSVVFQTNIPAYLPGSGSIGGGPVMWLRFQMIGQYPSAGYALLEFLLSCIVYSGGIAYIEASTVGTGNPISGNIQPQIGSSLGATPGSLIQLGFSQNWIFPYSFVIKCHASVNDPTMLPDPAWFTEWTVKSGGMSNSKAILLANAAQGTLGVGGVLSALSGITATGAASSFGTASTPQLAQFNGYEVTGLLAQQLARSYG